MRRLSLFPALLVTILLSSCEKKSVDENTCDEMVKAKISVAKTSYYAGEEIKMSMPDIKDVYCNWYGSGAGTSVNFSNNLTVSNCSKKDQGWYYASLSYAACNVKTDSVYITVVNRPVTPTCSPTTNNAISFNNLSTISGTPSWGYYSSGGGMRAYLSSSSGDFQVMFSSYWNGKDLEDGEYSVVGATSTLGYYQTFISCVSQSIYFASSSGKLYVTHVGGKAVVTLCGVSLSGSLGGPSYTTQATGKITLP